MISLDVIRTLYPHWGSHSGIHQFVRYLDADRFSVRLSAVPMGDDVSLPDTVKKRLKDQIARNRVAAYGLNDFMSEVSVLRRALIRPSDIVHVVDAEHSLMYLPRWFAAHRSIKRLPRIVAMFHQPVAILDGLINRDIVKGVDCVLVVAPEQVEYFKEFIPAEKVRMILHGVDTEYFRPAGAEKEKKKFICLAAGVWLREYGAVIETARILKEKEMFEFHIISPELQVPDGMSNIVVHRNIPDEEMLRLYQEAHVLFMPLGAATANNVLLEGSACGLPVVSTDIQAVRTYFPGDEAILVGGNDPHVFAAVLTELSEDRCRHEAMSRKARARAEELSWKGIAEEYAELYVALCS